MWLELRPLADPRLFIVGETTGLVEIFLVKTVIITASFPVIFDLLILASEPPQNPSQGVS